MLLYAMDKGILIAKATRDDLQEILDLQKLAFLSQAEIYDDYTLPPLHQTLEEINDEFGTHVFLKASAGAGIVGSVRAHGKDSTCFIGKLIVNPAFQNQGIGKRLMNEIENRFSDARRFEIFTGNKSAKSIYLYEKLGYEVLGEKKVSDKVTLLFMGKDN